jgi:hypothetical protein
MPRELFQAACKPPKLRGEYGPFYIRREMKNWKLIAEAMSLDPPDASRVAAPLDALEAAFRPLVKTIPHDVEPALSFRAASDVPEEQG